MLHNCPKHLDLRISGLEAARVSALVFYPELRDLMYPITPSSIHPPFARYSHGVEVPTGSRLVYCSGQLGISPSAEIPEEVDAQTALCFENISAILAEVGLDLSSIVRINAYVTDRTYLKDYMKVRDRLFDDPLPASTLMIVSGFANEAFKVEIEVVAAGPA